MSGYDRHHQFFNKVPDTVGYITHYFTKARETTGTFAAFSTTEPVTGTSIPTFVVIRNFLRRADIAFLLSHSSHGVTEAVQSQAGIALTLRLSCLAAQADVSWVTDHGREIYGGDSNLFTGMDWASSIRPTGPPMPHTSTPSLYVCLSTPSHGALMHSTVDSALFMPHLKPGDAILLHGDSNMRLVPHHEDETVFLQLFSNREPPPPAHFVDPIPALAEPEQQVVVETEEEKEERELLAEVEAEVNGLFEAEEKKRDERIKELREEKEKINKEYNDSVERGRKLAKRNELMARVSAQRTAAWEQGQKSLAAEEKEVAEGAEARRLQLAAELGTVRQVGVGPTVNVEPARIVISLSTSPVLARMGKGRNKENGHSGTTANLDLDVPVKEESADRPTPTKDIIGQSTGTYEISTSKRKAASPDEITSDSGKVTRRGRPY